jgi:hypothetical protein
VSAEAVERYRWTRDPTRSGLADAGCVTVVRGLEAAGVVAGFGGDPTGPATPVDPAEPPIGGDIVVVGTVGDAVVAVEYNGFLGSRPEVLRVVARGGLAVSVYWNVNALTRFSYALDGEVVTAFETLFPGDRSGTDPDRPPPRHPAHCPPPRPSIRPRASRSTGAAPPGTDGQALPRTADQEEDGGVEVVAALVGLAPALLLLALLAVRTRQVWPRRPPTSAVDWPGQGGDPAGDREPRRPLVPAGSGSAALAVPRRETEDGEPASPPGRAGGVDGGRRLRAS